jgi:hypothetical protein
MSRKYIILPSRQAYEAMENVVQKTRHWHGRGRITARYSPVPRIDAEGNYPFPVLDAASEGALRGPTGGDHINAQITSDVRWHEPEAEE